MKQNCKIELKSFFKREEILYVAVIKILDGEDVIDGNYIDLATNTKWTVNPLVVFRSVQAHSENKKMIELIPKDDIQVPYKGMLLEKVEEGIPPRE